MSTDLECVDVTPGNSTRYELVIGRVDDRILVAWPDMHTAAWFPTYDCIPSYVQEKLRVGFADGVAIRNILLDQGWWDE